MQKKKDLSVYEAHWEREGRNTTTGFAQAGDENFTVLKRPLSRTNARQPSRNYKYDLQNSEERLTSDLSPNVQVQRQEHSSNFAKQRVSRPQSKRTFKLDPRHLVLHKKTEKEISLAYEDPEAPQEQPRPIARSQQGSELAKTHQRSQKAIEQEGPVEHFRIRNVSQKKYDEAVELHESESDVQPAQHTVDKATEKENHLGTGEMAEEDFVGRYSDTEAQL